MEMLRSKTREQATRVNFKMNIPTVTEIMEQLECSVVIARIKRAQMEHIKVVRNQIKQVKLLVWCMERPQKLKSIEQ